MKSLALVTAALLQGTVATECAAGDAQCQAVYADDAEDMKVSLLQARQRKSNLEGEDDKMANLRDDVEVDPVECDDDPAAALDEAAAPAAGGSYSRSDMPVKVWSDFETDADDDEDQTPHPKHRQYSYGGGNCAEYGCYAFKRGRNCQCNKECAKFSSCCSDYAEICNHEQTTTTTTIAAGVETGGDGGAAVDSPSEVEGVFGHPSASITYPKYPGFKLMLAEEFDVPIDLDHDKIWTWSDGGLREGEVRFVKEQITFKDGKMTITVSNKRPFPAMQSCSMASKEHIPHKPLVSGELRTLHNMFRYGMYEVRMKAPEVQPGNPNVDGNFIATMFVYRDANAHHWREIDFEITGDRANSLTTNLLFADGTKNWRAYLQDSRKPNLGHVNVRKDFHTYRFEWTSHGVTWYFDDKVIRKGSRLHTPDKSCKIMLNTWIFTGGGFGGGAIRNNRYPMHTVYEYFRFYKWDQEHNYPCKDLTSTSCLTEDDMYLSTNNPCDGIPQKGHLGGLCKATCHR